MVVRISGTKSRMDVDTGEQVVTTISDTATSQAYVLRSDDKTAALIPTDAAACRRWHCRTLDGRGHR